MIPEKTIHRRSFLGASSLGLVAGAAISKARAAGKADSVSSVVQTSTGRLRGTMDNKVHVFKGVPYGASTSEARGDSCLRANRKPGPACATRWSSGRPPAELPSHLIPESMAQQPASDAHGTEDCLHLNVWTPGLARGKRPVMVWYHGGGYSAGSANWNMYNGANLAAKHDVVVVTVNHRLNVFGYLYLAGLGGEKYAQSRNVGMLDIVASLEWVRDNIAQFGGDPGNVTIFGQSGGGGKVSTLLAMPAAQGLFHRAIAMSGSEVRGVPVDRANKSAEAFLATLGLKPNQVDELQAMPQDKLLEAMRATKGLQLAPVVDGRTLPANPFDPTAPADVGECTVPSRVHRNRGYLVWNSQLRPSHRRATARPHPRNTARGRRRREQADRYLSQGPAASQQPRPVLHPVHGRLGFRVGIDTEAERKAALAKAPVYKYYFQWYSPVREGKLRSYHTLDIPFVFDNVDIAESMVGSGAGALFAGCQDERRMGRLRANRESESQRSAEMGAFRRDEAGDHDLQQ